MDSQSTWRYSSVLSTMEDAIIRLSTDTRSPDDRLKRSIERQHLEPDYFWRFYYLQLGHVKLNHPYVGEQMTQYLAECRLWEKYFDKTQHPFIGKLPPANYHPETPQHRPSPAQRLMDNLRAAIEKQDQSSSSSSAAGSDNDTSYDTSVEHPASVASASTTLPEKTITMTLSEYNRVIAQHYEAGKEDGMKAERENFASFKEDMENLVLMTKRMTNEVLAESREERAFMTGAMFVATGGRSAGGSASGGGNGKGKGKGGGKKKGKGK